MFFPLLLMEEHMRAAPGLEQMMEFHGAPHVQMVPEVILETKGIGDTVPQTAVDSKSLKKFKFIS